MPHPRATTKCARARTQDLHSNAAALEPAIKVAQRALLNGPDVLRGGKVVPRFEDHAGMLIGLDELCVTGRAIQACPAQ
jgi:hypothetical protein